MSTGVGDSTLSLKLRLPQLIAGFAGSNVGEVNTVKSLPCSLA